MENKDKFWKRWEEANEIEQLEIIKELPMFKDYVFSPTLINSYFVDLYRYIRLKEVKGLDEKSSTYRSMENVRQ